MKGFVHSIESMAARDGEGLRCAVFMAGCPLRCVYCHNPDTWDLQSGREYSPQELFRKLLRFRPYFQSRGGVTFSGGEPLLQAPFLAETMSLLLDEGISVTVDTSGAIPTGGCVKQVLSQASRILLDLKFFDDEHYLRYTGSSIKNTLETLRYLEENQKEVVVRTVIVPGLNDSFAHLDAYLDVLRPFTCVVEYELLAFHTMGFFKYCEAGLENPLEHTPALSPERLAELQAWVDEKRK